MPDTEDVSCHARLSSLKAFSGITKSTAGLTKTLAAPARICFRSEPMSLPRDHALRRRGIRPTVRYG
ncbi:hypothetical protein GWL_14710 [Herbaspirillum sp. GW103]|nr:hypothetical protein GWL_14710 [Herbaspirillum sp. GW103]